MEFFIFFFDLVKHALLKDVEQSHREGKVGINLNSNFMTLIPKSDNPRTFADLRPISLYNLIYKLITKIISNKLKFILSRVISIEQFGLLKNRRIQEPIRITREILHTIKTKKMEALVVKLELIKAFDRVNWNFLRLILLQIGLPSEAVNWIMGCVSSTNFSILINESPYGFFNHYKGH